MIDYTRRLLDLHLSQATNALKKAKSYSYSDRHKEKYQSDLYVLFERIQEAITASNPQKDPEIFKFKKHLDFIFKSLEFLGSSTLNLIPYEIVECLRYAMSDWIDETDEYIIVTSLINNVEEFSYDPEIAFNDQLYSDIKECYGGLTFERKLVQINLPRSLSRDYLSAVVLYHELGHFIDMKMSIMESLVLDLEGRFVGENFSKDDIEKIKEFLPFFERIESRPFADLIQVHLAEYFCDLFASQYIGEASNHFLSYVTEKSEYYEDTHPSTINRIKVVKDFIDGNDNIIVKLISEAIKRITKKDLSIRFEKINSEDFYNLLPVELTSVSQLHGIYDYAWRFWLAPTNELEEKLELQKPIVSEKVYSIINNLTEKSIGNFITLNKWNKVYP